MKKCNKTAKTADAKTACKKPAVEKTCAKKPCGKKACAKKACTKQAVPATKQVTLTVRAGAGKDVFLAGCFNGWDPAASKMTDAKGDGVYAATLDLAPGTYQYKFVVDGVWQADPENADWVANDMGTINSVLVVK